MAGGWFEKVAPFLSQGINLAGGFVGGHRQFKYQKRLNAQQYRNDMAMMQYQLDYNSPKNQMARFLEAGLNPNLVYGQGTPGNLESPPKYPHTDAPDMSFTRNVGSGLLKEILESKLMLSQANLTDQKTLESGTKQDLMKAQKALVEANPMLNQAYVSALVTNLEATARLKRQEADFMTGQSASTGATTQGEAKMMLEINRLAQQFDLGNADKAIKAKILESKGFQNELQRIQVEWMRDKEITPQHIYMGIMLILQKLM